MQMPRGVKKNYSYANFLNLNFPDEDWRGSDPNPTLDTVMNNASSWKRLNTQ